MSEFLCFAEALLKCWLRSQFFISARE